MTTERIQVKYCKGEQELNDFLATLHVDHQGYPHLHSISYVSEVHGHGTDVETFNGTKSEVHMGSNIIAAVQYFIQIEDNEK